MSASARAKSPIVFGCEGPHLSDAERRFFTSVAPVGFILFARNCETPGQVSALVADLRQAVGYHAPVMIDQEGGRVARLGPPHWWKPPAAAVLGALPDDRAAEAVRLNTTLIALQLTELGIDMDCAPLIDVPAPDGHDIIGDRAFCADAERVGRLGRVMAETFLSLGVMPIIKHIPGHGRARADSHHELPLVDASLDDLQSTDFRPFRDLADMPWAMTAHIVYSAIDADRPATLSTRLIDDVIRKSIGFDGVLITDDLSMKALAGSFEEKADAALAAGCDLVLHCNGDMTEMRAVADGASRISDAAKVRLRAAEERVSAVAGEGIDPAEALARLKALIGDQGT